MNKEHGFRSMLFVFGWGYGVEVWVFVLEGSWLGGVTVRE